MLVKADVIWQNPQKNVLVGNHLDTLFLFIASMGDVNRITHNRRKDFGQGSSRQKVDLEEKKLLGRATALKLCIFSLQFMQPQVDEEIKCMEDNENCHAWKTILVVKIKAVVVGVFKRFLANTVK